VFPELQNDPALELGQHLIDLLASTRNIAFEEEDAAVKKALAQVYDAKGDTGKAARTLEKINLENAARVVSPDEKAEVYVQIAEYWFQEDDHVNAEKYLNKAAHIIHEVKDRELRNKYKVFHANIMDTKRRFLVAAYSYYDLSNQEGMDQAQVTALLTGALQCAILAPAGPQKARILTILHKDLRCHSLEHFELLDKMYVGKIIKKPDVQAFEDALQAHQKVVSADGFTVLGKALIEHNIEVISKIYSNISFQELGRFLEIPSQQAEGIIAQMVSENRIKASLDQRAQIIEFLSSTSGDQAMHKYNSQVYNVCNDVTYLIQEVLKKHPDLQKYDTHMIQ
jgi:COP9 signalosome complex subunit 4